VLENGEVKFRIRLFGAFEACVEGKPLPPLRSQKGHWLLALLALRQGQEVPRALLAQTLWPESLPSNALTGLRQNLADLRKALGAVANDIIDVTPRTLCLAVEGVEVDVRAFDRAIEKGDPQSLQRAAALYGGPLLQEYAEPWIVGEREAREQRYVKAVEQLAALAGAAGSDAEAIDYLRRGIAVDPINEPLIRALLRALAKTGDYGGIVPVYQGLIQRLNELFQAAPASETQGLYQQLRAEGRRRARIEPPRPLSPAAAPPIRVPHPLTPLIGREEQIRTLSMQLATVRMVTVVGAGGAGKTRLVIHVATELAANYADGVWFIDLSALTAPELITQQVAQALCLPEERGRTRRETLLGFLQPKQLLLVLDNCEHLIAALAELAATLLSHCPALHILATSRQKLGLMGEQVCHLNGLALPTNTPHSTPEPPLQSEAEQLFLARAQAVNAEFEPKDDTAQAVAALCRKLDGLPLAIELAAALIETLTPQEILARLETGRDLPSGDNFVRPHRHQTLEALMESSYCLLSPSEQTLMRRLAVFAGGCTLHDCEVVCREPAPAMSPDRQPDSEADPHPDLLPDLSRLVSKSLVIVEARAGASRYRMLDTIHRYAARQLEQRGESAALHIRHCDYFLQLAEEADSYLTGPDQTRRLARLDEELDNLRVALRTAETTNGRIMLRLVNALGRFWQIRGYWSEGRNWIDRALALPQADSADALRANALNWASMLATYQGDLSRGEKYAALGLSIWEKLVDTRGMANSLGCLGIVVCNRGDYAGSRRYHAQSLDLARANGDETGMAGELGYLGNVAMAQGDYEAARAYYAESLALRRKLQDVWGVAASLNNLGLLARHDRDWKAAHRFLEESLTLRRQLGDRRCVAITLNLLGLCACEQEEVEPARRYLTEGLAHCREIGDRRSIAYALEAFASLAHLEGQPERAVRLLGAASALREEIASPLPPSEQPEDLARKRALRETLGEEAFMEQWNAGRTASPQTVMD
jgi:predicted ATPase/DNA-binding SARP family transcriptional activator